MFRSWVHLSTAIEVAISALVLILLMAGSRTLMAGVPTQAEIKGVLDSRSLEFPFPGFAPDWDTLQKLYGAREFKPAWFGYANNDRIDAALFTLEHADEEGLESSSYPVDELKNLRRRMAPQDFEFILSATMLRYARDLYLGRRTGFVDRDISLPRSDFDASQTVADALSRVRPDASLRFPTPPHVEYEFLKRALARYRAILMDGGWDDVPAYRANDRVYLIALRARLGVEDPDVVSLSTDVTDAELEPFIRRFQMRHGLKVDGVVGPATLAAMNVSASDRVDQIKANMERWRWVGPREKTDVEINVPAAMLIARKDGKVILSSRIIVGKPDTRTPMFHAHITGVTANPPWDVPAKIAREEILPKIQRDPNYLAKHHMIVTAQGGYRQLPGSDNALGALKLEMPNPFGTYLHDTSSRSLFASDMRFLSHGCMRVEQIKPLAYFVLEIGGSATTYDLDTALASNKTQLIRLSDEVPVYVLYWTAVADPDGLVIFFPDIYGRDKRLNASLRANLMRASNDQNNMLGCKMGDPGIGRS